ncbi:MAG: VOC family protein [Anaerolineales bacterium]|nr:VOC family protein [Anaerolineales bacterium]
MIDAGFVIHPATRIGHVHLRVADLKRQIEFYEHVLGFSLHWRQERKAGLGAGGADLLRMSEDRDAQRTRGTTGLYHFAVLFPSRRELARAIARLLSLRYPNSPTDHLITETTYLDDPEGNGIELYIDTPERGRWDMSDDGFGAVDAQGNQHSGREPLDVEALLRELQPGDSLEQPAPEGIRVGHVHLHVADVAESNRFYHDLLGFEIQGQSAAVGVSFVSAGGYHHHIGLNTWLGQSAPPAADGALGMRYFQVVLPDESELKLLTDRLEQANLSIERNEDGVLVRDPSRNGVLLTAIQNLER